jgi:predicted nucleic acid-binding protein
MQPFQSGHLGVLHHFVRERDECEYSFVDATSFAVMRSLRIREAIRV